MWMSRIAKPLRRMSASSVLTVGIGGSLNRKGLTRLGRMRRDVPTIIGIVANWTCRRVFRVVKSGMVEASRGMS